MIVSAINAAFCASDNGEVVELCLSVDGNLDLDPSDLFDDVPGLDGGDLFESRRDRFMYDMSNV